MKSPQLRHCQASAPEAVCVGDSKGVLVMRLTRCVQFARLPLMFFLLSCLVLVSPGQTIPNINRRVHVLSVGESPDRGIFPSDVFTVRDPLQMTGLRVNL